jgi:hypothetical protein
MKDLTKTILNQIEKNEIKPISRGLFLLRNLGLWSLAVISLALGSLSVTLLAYNISSKDWDIYTHLNESWFGFFVSSLPYLWIVLTMISLLVAIFNIEHSKNGYKYSPLKLTLLSLVASIIVGFVTFSFGAGQKIDNYVGQVFPSYTTTDSEKVAIWNQPTKGLFSGTIQTIGQNSFTVLDSSGKIWQVDYRNATVRGGVRIQIGTEVKIMGENTDSNDLSASEIRPWGNSGGGHGFGQRKNIE